MESDGTSLRTLILSQRGALSGPVGAPAYAAWFEAEDVLARATNATIHRMSTSLSRTSLRTRRVVGRTTRRLLGQGRMLPRMGALEPIDGQYDLAVAVLRGIWDLPMLEAIPGLRGAASRLVVWLPEVWPSDLQDRRLRYEPFALADDVFVGMTPSVALTSDLLDRQVHHLPLAVDIERFCPTSLDSSRPVDVLNIGRRLPDLHNHLLKWSEDRDKYYLFDTFTSATVEDPRQHRSTLGSQYRRSSVSICNAAKLDQPEVTEGYRMVPGRLFEGLASGTLMYGYPPDPTLQFSVVGAEVVNPLPESPADAVSAIADAVKRDDRAERSRNISLAMQRHDWSHRWVTMFEILGIPLPPALTSRVERLNKLSKTYHYV